VTIIERANTGGTTRVVITPEDRKRHTKQGHKPAEAFGKAMDNLSKKNQAKKAMKNLNLKDKPSGKHYDPNHYITKKERKIKKILIKTGKFIIYFIVWVILTQLLVKGLLLFIVMDRDILTFFVGTAVIFFLLEINRKMFRKKI
jgi:hypothetical protein